ncbi:helix-turn-helix domain-containing protein [Rhodobacter sphaeroides]|uniref:Transcriptional regulator n=2 Tax=Cereibacter sphaeroides TaxID=1063 RepID=Q3J5Y2_CERS4|nr:helix-turn-helix transcriptional regulator [Cereibacter sphaeroides]ABA77802.1 putative transcriptional regulator [Cereibacter sphaeroides 2.4.1]AXC60043.1 XRE family transcriptional regulator [Cereibacter sphaeroides 2.4.1]MVX48951.1 helix-turn-helix domain-containing protein [Cereibacter sphaeroides]MWP40002.1 helix-turn-helix domain-containing protein [Cereibacter sphaeroides]QHA12437.1 helix-turn-helix domain-containing protein [Cereibacter sphaeroides]
MSIRAGCRHSGRAFGVWAFYTKPMALRIKQLREARGWTQEVLAARSGMSRSQLAMIERETRPANTIRLNAIAGALGVSTEDLFESNPRERALLELIRLLPSEDVEALIRVAEGLAAKSQA